MAVKKFKIVALLILALIINTSFGAYSSLKKSLVNEDYIKAQQLFIDFKLNKFNVPVSQNLKNLLKQPAALNFIVKETIALVNQAPDNTQVDTQIKKIADNMARNYSIKLTNDPEKAELEKLIVSLVKPELLLRQTANTLNRAYSSYKSLMDTLGSRMTANGTQTLKEWAIKDLISQAIETGISLVENQDSQGKTFIQFSPAQKQEVLTDAAAVTARSFLQNINALSSKFKFTIPDINLQQIENLIVAFLKNKFS